MPIVRLTVVGFPGGSTVKNLPAKQDTRVGSLGGVDPLEEENSERDGNTRPPDVPLEKPVCRSGSNS